LSGQTTFASPAETSYFGNSPSYGGNPYIVSPTRLETLDIYNTGPLSTGKFGGTSLTVDVPINDALDVKSISAFRKFVTDVQPSTVGQGLLYGPVVNPTTYAYEGIQRVSPYLLEYGLLGRPDGDLSRQEQFSQEFQLSGDLGSANKYVAGVFAFDEEVSEGYIAYLTIPLPPTAAVGLPSYGGVNYWGHSESFAGYISDTFTPPVLDNKLEFTGGVRYTKDIKALDYLSIPQLTLPTENHEASFADPSGDFTAKYQWTQDLMSYVRFANAYKSGGFSGRDAYNAPGYKPETANNWEIGGKSDWLDRRIRLNADLFYTIYTNKQVTTFAPGLGSNGINESHIVNAGKAVYPGGEVELELAPVKGWDVDINYGHVNPKYKEFLYQPTTTSPVQNIAANAKFPYFSNTSYSIANTYTFAPTPIGILSARVEFDYKSGMYFFPSDLFNPLNEQIKAGSQNILNANVELGHIPVAGKAELAVSIYGRNLLNKAYVVQAVDYEIIPAYDYFSTGIFARPRVLGIQLTGKY
jgi:iron complex outermembrane receptor protein